MKNILLIANLLIFSIVIKSQDGKGFDNEFLKYFPENTSTRSDYGKIPLNEVSKYLGDTIKENYTKSRAILKVLKDKKVLIIYELSCEAGAICGAKNYAIFTKSGKLLQHENIINEYGDLESGNSLSINKVDSLLEFIYNEYEDSDESSYDTLIYRYKYFDGESLRDIQTYFSRERKFTAISNRILTIQELDKFSKAQLDIMRNEIFADHGYIFKTQKWKEYFSDKSWYTPRYVDVNDKLTDIEKINIQTILEVSKIKSKPR